MPALFFLLFAVLASMAGQAAAPLDARASQLKDLAQLRRYIELDAAYSDAQRARASQALGEAESHAGRWTAAEFELQVAHVVALADNGHSTVWGGARSGRMNRLPVRLVLLGDGVFVARAKGAGLPALGMRVDAIDGIATAEVLRKLRAYRGGTDNLRDQDNLSLLESPQLLHAAGIAQSQGEATLSLSSQGRTRSVTMSALPPNPSDPDAGRLRYLAAQPMGREGADWQSPFAGTAIPLWLQQPDQAFRLEPLPQAAAVYLQLKSNMDAADGERIGAFLALARRSIAGLRPQNVIVDMRFNGGGDYTKTASFMSDLPGMIPPSGRVFVITHASTFSAGISSVGFVKQAAPHQVTIVGEPVGDRLIFYGEPRKFLLPNSGIGLSYATGLHDYQHGCRWFGPCYWVNWLFPISVSSLSPDIAAPLTYGLAAAGRDPSMEAIAAELKRATTRK